MNTASPEDRPELAPREAAVGSQRREVNRIAAIIMARDEDVVPLAIIVETVIALLLAHEPDHLYERHPVEPQFAHGVDRIGQANTVAPRGATRFTGRRVWRRGGKECVSTGRRRVW